MSIPSFEKFAQLFPSEEACIQFLKDREVFYTTLPCESCGQLMRLDSNGKRFRCMRSGCLKRLCNVSSRKGTFFFNSRLSCLQIMKLSVYWLANCPVQSTIILSGHGSETVCAFFKHFRNLVGSSLVEENQIIGGPNIDVEIDETKLGKRKYHRGHRVDGVWVVVGIEKVQNGKIFLKQVENRDCVTLQNIILDHVLPGTKIHTDCWRGYGDLNSLGYIHMKVNHSQNFVDPVTLACTNTVEGLNCGLKRKIPIRNRTRDSIDGFLGEYVWRRQNKNRLFDAFVDAIRDIDYNLE